MKKDVLSDRAESDIDDIVEYTLTHWGQRQATEYLNDLHSNIIALCSNPDIGIPRSDVFLNLLSFPIKRHILYYIKKEDGIKILRILHVSMSPDLHCIN